MINLNISSLGTIIRECWFRSFKHVWFEQWVANWSSGQNVRFVLESPPPIFLLTIFHQIQKWEFPRDEGERNNEKIFTKNLSCDSRNLSSVQEPLFATHRSFITMNELLDAIPTFFLSMIILESFFFFPIVGKTNWKYNPSTSCWWAFDFNCFSFCVYFLFFFFAVDLLQMLEFNVSVRFPAASLFTVILALCGKFD